MKPWGPKESELVAAAGARSIAGWARPCLEARSCAQSGAKPCTSTVHDLWDARVPVRLGTTVRPQFFSRLNRFCEGRLQILVFVFRKTALGDFSRAFSPCFSVNRDWIKGWELCSWIDRRAQWIKVRFPCSHFVILTQVCIFNQVFEFLACDWDYWNDYRLNPLSWVRISPCYVIWIYVLGFRNWMPVFMIEISLSVPDSRWIA